jgi:hypothetical protein
MACQKQIVCGHKKFWPKHALIHYLMKDSDNDDDNVDSVSDIDFQPETARKIKKTVCHLSSGPESRCATKQHSNNKRDLYTQL